jgi:hypothetical protein
MSMDESIEALQLVNFKLELFLVVPLSLVEYL